MVFIFLHNSRSLTHRTATVTGKQTVLGVPEGGGSVLVTFIWAPELVRWLVRKADPRQGWTANTCADCQHLCGQTCRPLS